MQFGNLTLARRLGLSFAALVLLSLLGSGLSLYQMTRIHAALEEVVLVNGKKVELLNDMSGAVHVVSRVSRTLALLTDDAEQQAEMTKIAAARDRYNKAEAELYKFPATPEAQVQRDAITAARDKARLLNDQAIKAGVENEFELATKLLLTSAGPAVGAWQAALEQNINYQEESNRKAFDVAQASYATARNLLVGLALVSLVGAALLATVVVRSVVTDLGGEPADARRVAVAIAEGNLGVAVPVSSGDTRSVMAAMHSMRDRLAAMVGEVRRSSDSIATGSSQIATGNADLSQRTEEQASNLQQTAASMEELTGTVKNNAETAQQANQLATGAAAAAARGGEVVGQVVATMQDIATASRKISDIIGVIDGIAFQTNILALNAAVEAARAGEQGRGFAVVASEVRSLAQRSAQAAKEIKSLIGSSGEKVELGARQVNDAGTSMAEIVRQVQQVSQLIGEISHATAEQSRGISQVGDAVGQLDQVTQQNAALVEESAAAAESLRQQAGRLVEVVGGFRLA
ncbi:methyl-accepting chemotaxis protein [Pseudaquabacterium pictum]|uniref:Methyl-accepting chemotaxis protein n=1 Tax=Pseudaquabacterium pictum TaxID=2315236 RepID=A0A480B0S7_9BURK|nr:methyl-accepting chemotaxis protein [Rubrivivax pictus]GCL65947.1 methyl-accepting chemotaxis protein [Rubrivivax pictus]